MKKMMFDSAIENWIEAIMSHTILIAEGHTHIHIDDLLGNMAPQQEMVTISIQAFQKLIEHAAKLGTPVKLSLIIPMTSLGDKISLSIPQSIQDVTLQLDFEPPSLWIINWQTLFSPLISSVVIEEYRAPLRFSMLEDNDENIVAYYHEYRNKEEFYTNQEVKRRIYIDCFKYKTVSLDLEKLTKIS
ncbi:MAG: hypothetical protein IAE79_02425 [Anaerolinea sp.]|nr:hypothetical protein [Anaerolinea sp.]